MRRASLVVRSVWAACLMIGCLNHARILLEHGLLWDYGGVALPSAVYWSSLTIIDPLAAALLFLRPKVGIPLTVLLIVTNVSHNVAITLRDASADDILPRLSHPFVISQISFMLFVTATFRIAWKGLNDSGGLKPSGAARPSVQSRQEPFEIG